MATAAVAPAVNPVINPATLTKSSASAGAKALGIFKKLYPFLSIGAGMAGGPIATMAMGHIGTALGLTPDQIAATKPEQVPDQMAAAMTSEAGRIQLDAAEKSFQATMAQMGIDSEAKMEGLANDDRANARAREIAVRDKTPEIAFYLLLVMFMVMFGVLCFTVVPDANKVMVISMTTSVGTLVIAAATYFYGTTRNSGRKDDNMATLVQSIAGGGGQ